MMDIINIVASILLGMSIIGTCACVLLFIIVKLFNIESLIKTLSKLCIFFAVTWILNIVCNVFVLLTTPDSGMAKVSKSVVKDTKPGTVVLSNDTALPQKDHIIILNTKNQSIDISIWDFAEEDGDSIEILFNGQPISNLVQLKNSPKTISIPTNGTLQIKGAKDKVPSITYAIYIPETKKTYLNSVFVGTSNTYTIKNKN